MTQSTLRVVARVTALPDQVETLKSLLSTLLTPTRQEVGCLQYELYQNQADPTDFTFVEMWETEQDLERHLHSPHIQQALSQLEGLVAHSPDIRRYQAL